MKNYSVTGTDRETNYDSILVVRAPSPELAKAQGEVKGIAVEKVVELNAPEPADALHDSHAIQTPLRNAHDTDTRLGAVLFWLIVMIMITATVAGVTWLSQ